MLKKVMFHVKHIISVIMTVVIMTMAVSADYKAMTLLDSGWGVGSVYSDSIGKGKIQSYIDAAGYTDNNSYEDFVYWSIPIKSGYTYKLTYQLNTNANYINPQSSGTYKSSAKQPVFTNLTDTVSNATVSIERQGSTYYFTVIFNQEKSNIPAAESIYIYQFMNKQQLSTITVSGIGAAAYYDPGAAGYTQELVEMVAQMQQQDSNFYTNALEVLDSIKTEQQSTNTKIDGLPDKIGQELQEESDREKQEASTTGDAALQQGKDALESILDINSLKDAITPLITACSYQGIESSWTFPRIKLPAIQGIMEETSLNDEIQINITDYAEQYIPQVLLTLIRSLLTAGLIVYAIREVITIVNNVIPS